MHALILALSGLVVAVAFGVFIPWCTRLLAIYWAHFIRDRIYAVGDANPTFRETLIYRDAEWMACLVINALRERDGKLLDELARVMTKEKEPLKVHDEWRRRRYALEIEEIFTGRDGFDANSQLVDAFLELDKPVVIAKCGRHPSHVIALMVLLPLTIAKAVFDRMTPAAKSERVIVKADRTSHKFRAQPLPMAA